MFCFGTHSKPAVIYFQSVDRFCDDFTSLKLSLKHVRKNFIPVGIVDFVFKLLFI